MFVVAFLIESKQTVIIPEHFIYDLNEKKLKNHGVNPNQRHRIFFSKEWFENHVQRINLDKKFTPNFNLRPSSVYPLPDNVDEAVFHAKLRKFEDTFESAMLSLRLRSQDAPVYNPVLPNQQPIPRADLTMDTSSQAGSSSQSSSQSDTNQDSGRDSDAAGGTQSVDIPQTSNEISQSDVTTGTNNQNESSSSSSPFTGANSSHVSVATAPIASNDHEDQVSSDDIGNREEDNLDSTFFTSTEFNDPNALVLSEEVDIKPVVDAEDMVAFVDIFGGSQAQVEPTQSEPTQNESTQIEHSGPLAESTRFSAIDQSSSADQSYGLANRNIGSGRISDGSSEVVIPMNISGQGNSNELRQDEHENNDEMTNADSEKDKVDKAERMRQINENAAAVLLHGEKVVVSDDVEYMYLPNQVLKAIESVPQYEVKKDDLLCGNIPFKPYLNGDRFFMVAKDDGFEEVKLFGPAVTGLLKLNRENRNEQFDLRFIKGMFIGFCTMKKAKEFETTEDIGKTVLVIMKDLFGQRVDGHGDRLNKFEALVMKAMRDIKINKFK